MNAIELIITVCAVLSPNTCEERHLSFSAEFSLQQCTHECAALYRAVDRGASEVDGREMALRISAYTRKNMKSRKI